MLKFEMLFLLWLQAYMISTRCMSHKNDKNLLVDIIV